MSAAYDRIQDMRRSLSKENPFYSGFSSAMCRLTRRYIVGITAILVLDGYHMNNSEASKATPFSVFSGFL